MKKTLILMGALVAMTACTTKETTPSTKSLVLYYSQTGATEQVAQYVQQQTGADIEAITLAVPYDGDFQSTIARCQEEMTNGTLPELNAMQKNVADYDTIYIGYPVWFGTYAMPIASLVKSNDFAGKVIIPFCTFGSGGLNTSSDQLKAALPQATVLPGYGVRNARVAAAEAEVKQFLINSDIIAGEKLILPEFSEARELNEYDLDLFNAACSSYSMPLGTPEMVSVRDIPTGVEYLFEVDNNGAKAKIYVLATGEDDPVFTQVVR